MKRIFLLSWLMLASPLMAEMDFSVKTRVAAFFPAADRFREVYGQVMPCYQVEAAMDFGKCYYLWSNIDWLYRNGSSNHLDYFTNVNITNLSAGISFPHRLAEKLFVYAGIGPSLGYIHIHNRFVEDHQHESKFAIGVVVKSGLVYEISCRFFAELFLDYLYQPTHFRKNIDVGGAKAGFGVGVRF